MFALIAAVALATVPGTALGVAAVRAFRAVDTYNATARRAEAFTTARSARYTI